MKSKNIIAKIFTIFLLIAYLYFSKDVYAVDLKFMANITKGATVSEIIKNSEAAKSSQTEQVAVITNLSKTYGNPSTDKEWTWFNQNNRGDDVSYTTYGISFWGDNYSAIYDSTCSNTYFKASYDEYSGDFIKSLEQIAASNVDISTEINKYTVIKENGKQKFYSVLQKEGAKPDLTFDLSLADGYFYRKKSISVQTSSTVSTTIHDSVITKKGLDKIVETYYKNGDQTYVENGYLKIRFSILEHTNLPDYTKLRPDGFMPTAYDAVNAARWMNENNLALPEKNPGVGKSGTSILNYYDNWLYIPLAKLNNRKLLVRYQVKNENGEFSEVKNEEYEFGAEAKEFNVATLGNDGIGNIESRYIGGQMYTSKTSLDDAKDKIKNATSKWGWGSKGTVDFDNKKIKIAESSSNDEEYIVIDLYYDYTNVSVSHLKTDGSVIRFDWNKTHKLRTRDGITLDAMSSPLYLGIQKYIHVSTEADGKTSTAKTVKINGIDGSNKLKFGQSHYVKFFYEYEPPRQVFVRHLVYNESTKKYEVSSILTNSNAAIKDGEDSKYYLRNNGYVQRLFKSGWDVYTSSITPGYNEQYTIDFSDTIKLDKSRTIENEGIKYEYQGVKYQNNNPLTILTKSQAGTLDKKAVTLLPAKVTKTYVDFYYTQSAITPPGDPNDPNNPDDPDDPDEPTIDFIPKTNEGELELGSEGSTGDCKIVYVPSGEKLKSYMKAVSYRPYSLIYDGESVNETTGEITYKLKKYDAYTFVNGLIKNGSTEYGSINSTGRNGVFHRDSDTPVTPRSETINDLVSNSINNFAGLNPNNITNVPDGRVTVETDFPNWNNTRKIEENKYNGIRVPDGQANYNVVSLVSDGTISQTPSVKTENIAVNTKDNTKVNIFTPATISDLIIESEKVVNHSNQDTFVIQKNSQFTVTPVPGETTDYNNLGNTSKYIRHYWFVADFDVKLVGAKEVYDKDSDEIKWKFSGDVVKAGNLIKINKSGSLTAIATNDETNGDIINQFSNKIKVIAVTYNLTTEDNNFEKKILDQINVSTRYSTVDPGKIIKVTSTCEQESYIQSHKDLGLQNTMYDDAHYFVEYTKTSKNIGRIYDFKITDCLDVNLKNIFRKSNTGTVNDLRGIQYFSGMRKLLVYGGAGIQLGANLSNQNNIFADRVDSDTSINSVVSKTIVPLGPYKHIDTNYIQAPKLGYRISFDLKTTGVYQKSTAEGSPVRYIKITPSYYYISKDGKTFKENINLYYKNSSGKYVNFEGSGYTIYFKPNDGYRIHYNQFVAGELDAMSTKLEALKIGGTSTDKSFKLTDSMMSYSDNNFVQAWYGEFKLPNSTIVVEEGQSINNPLIDGYVGVRFKMECVDKENADMLESEATIVSYNNQDKSYGENAINTTQWDYEGYLNFDRTNIGSNLSRTLRIQLEKDFWNINTQELYDKVKSTVVLYDLDNRAANDFD